VTIALFGGAFDPPHLGHVALVQHALARFGFERLLVVPAGNPPHKLVHAPAEVRARLAELAFGRIPRVEISRVELEPGGPRYTVDTLRWAREHLGEPTLVVGADQLASFLDWREPETILTLAVLAVATRPGYSEDDLEPVLSALSRPERVVLFPIPAHNVSSRALRERVRQRRPIDHLVPPAVNVEIERLGLYRT
jgi:nicotinate-nucleotide adenylyltransferase